MQFIKSDINIDFIGKRKIAFVLSVLFILISFGSLIVIPAHVFFNGSDFSRGLYNYQGF